jgi:hypothetical protein
MYETLSFYLFPALVFPVSGKLAGRRRAGKNTW